MNVEQAYETMRQGKRVRYKTWWWDAFLELKGSKLVDNNGRIIKHDDIFTEPEGWEIWEKRDGEAHD